MTTREGEKKQTKNTVTNANFLADIGQTLGIKAKASVSFPSQPSLDGEEEQVGKVKWMGLGLLTSLLVVSVVPFVKSS